MPIVHDSIRTNSNLDVYPTHEAKLGKGGYRTVANIAERDNIPFERCEEGMLVTVLEDNTNNNKTTTYILKQNTRDRRTWEKFNNGAVDADLTNRVTVLETSSAKVDNEIATLNSEISTKVSLDEHNNLVASLSSYALKSDLNTLATKDELNDKLDVSTYTADKDTFATKSELNNKADISSLDTLTTKDELNNLVYTKSQVDKKIADAVTGGSVNLDGYVKKDEIVNLATKAELNNKADRSDLDAKANSSDLQNLATKAEVNAKLDVSTYTTDKDTFATKDELNDKLDVSTYTADKATFTTKDELNTLVYTKSQVDEKIADAVTGGSVNLDGYVKKDEIVNLATKNELSAKLDVSTYTTDKDTFATKDELNLKADISSLDDLATKTELSNKADRSELDAKANSSDLQNLATKAELSSLATKDELSAKLDVSTYTTDKDTFATKTQLEGKANKDEVYSKTEIDDNYTTTEQLNLALASKADKSTVDSLATKVEVNEKISKLATKEELASGLATKADSSIIPTLATKDELNLKADISSLDDLATKTELSNKADRSELDTKANSSDLQNLATKEKVNEINSTLTNAINTKANTDTVVNLTDDQTIAGTKTFSSPVVVPKAVADNQAVILGQTLKILEESAEWTVGAGGKFTDLDSAIIEANKYYSRDYTKTITLKIISNITIDNRVSIFRGGCRVIVTCENENIVITVNKNSTSAYNYTFSGFNFEFRNVSIKVEGSSTDTHNGSLFCFENFKLINLKVTGKPCMIIHNNGGLVNNEIHKTDAFINQLNVEFSSKLTTSLVYVGNNSSLAITGSKDTNIISNVNAGFVSRSCSNIYFNGGITCNNVGTLFKVQWGGFISINAASENIVLNGAIATSQKVLVPTRDGLIFG